MNNELTAALLTIEKCRELSCCPAGVDLQDWVKQLAEESLQWQMSIPPRVVAGIKADGVEEWVSSRGGRWNGTTEEAVKFAKQLREGADK
ncbi:hypothetical protein RFD78_000808 [Klebsiella aerogenes]|nr:hypothetical protein [Klebsiella aerogenes]ELA0226286.1 hypothetical protein [Klebsiella aerogenes]